MSPRVVAIGFVHGFQVYLERQSLEYGFAIVRRVACCHALDYDFSFTEIIDLPAHVVECSIRNSDLVSISCKLPWKRR